MRGWRVTVMARSSCMPCNSLHFETNEQPCVYTTIFAAQRPGWRGQQPLGRLASSKALSTTTLSQHHEHHSCNRFTSISTRQRGRAG